jgi:hypothetical protein
MPIVPRTLTKSEATQQQAAVIAYKLRRLEREDEKAILTAKKIREAVPATAKTRVTTGPSVLDRIKETFGLKQVASAQTSTGHGTIKLAAIAAAGIIATTISAGSANAQNINGAMGAANMQNGVFTAMNAMTLLSNPYGGGMMKVMGAMSAAQAAGQIYNGATQMTGSASPSSPAAPQVTWNTQRQAPNVVSTNQVYGSTPGLSQHMTSSNTTIARLDGMIQNRIGLAYAGQIPKLDPNFSIEIKNLASTDPHRLIDYANSIKERNTAQIQQLATQNINDPKTGKVIGVLNETTNAIGDAAGQAYAKMLFTSPGEIPRSAYGALAPAYQSAYNNAVSAGYIRAQQASNTR